MKRLLTFFSCLAVVACAVMLTRSTLPLAVAQERATTREDQRSEIIREAEEGRTEFDAERAERRLDEIERLIHQAEDEGDASRVRQLRQEGERLLDALEAFERSQEEEEEEEEEEEGEGEEWEEEFEEIERHTRRLELHRMELEVQRLELELDVARKEAAGRLLAVASDQYVSKVYALNQLMQGMEEPAAAAELLENFLRENDDPVVARILRHQLADIYRQIDRPEQARKQLRWLIFGEPQAEN